LLGFHSSFSSFYYEHSKTYRKLKISIWWAPINLPRFHNQHLLYLLYQSVIHLSISLFINPPYFLINFKIIFR
jgi:hypothetical protein